MADMNQEVSHIDHISRGVDILQITFGQTFTRDIIYAVVENCGGNLDMSAETIITMMSDGSIRSQEQAESSPSSTQDAVAVTQTQMSNINESPFQESAIVPPSQFSYASAFKNTGAIPRPKSRNMPTVKVASPCIYPSGCEDQLHKIRQYHDLGYKTMIIMRGVPGSGKTFLANQIVNMTVGTNSGYTHVLSADDFFVLRGAYDSSLIGRAHQYNRDKMRVAIEQGLSPIIIDNTNTQIWEMEAYVREGVNNGYFIEIVQPKTPWAKNVLQLTKKNVHKVPRDKIERMLDRFENIKKSGILAEYRLSYPTDKFPPVLRDAPVFLGVKQLPNPNFPIWEPPQAPNASIFTSYTCSQNEATPKFCANHDMNRLCPEMCEAALINMEAQIEHVLKLKLEREWENGEDWNKLDNKGNTTETRSVSEPKPQRNKNNLPATVSSQDLMPLIQQSQDWKEISKFMPPWDHDFTEFSKTEEDPINVVTISCGTAVEVGDTAIHNNNKCLIVSATPRDINHYYMPKFENKIPDKRTLDKGTMTNEQQFADMYHCQNEDKHFLSLCKMFQNVSRDDLKEIFDKCHGDVNWAVEIIIESGISDQKQSNPEVIPDVEEASEGNFGCTASYNIIPDEEPEGNNDNVVVAVNSNNDMSSPSHLKKNRKDKPAHSESSMELKRQIEQNVVISDNHYSEHCLKIRKMRRGETEGENSQENLPAEEVDFTPENSPPKESTYKENVSSNSGYTSEEESTPNDPTLNVNLGTHFILFLDSVFGRNDINYTENIMPVVNMPISLLRQLNALWTESYSNQLLTQTAYSKILFKEDEEFARSVAQKESELSEAGKEPVVPDFKEIMDLDLALNLHRKDVADWKKGIPEDIAAKMTRDKLYNLFPNLTPEVLSELLMAHDNNFKATVEILLTSTDQADVLAQPNGLNKFVMDGELERQRKLLEVEKQRALDEDEWPLLNKGTNAVPSDLSTAEKYRKKALDHLENRNVNHNKAREYMRSGMTSIASYYSDVAGYHTRQYEQANSLAATSFIQYHAAHGATTTLDLHYLFVPEAMEALDMFIDHHIQNMRKNLDKTGSKCTSLYIITGRGQHSKGGPKIKPATKKRFKTRNLPHSDLNPGAVLVDVSIYDKLTEELRSES